MKTFLCRALLPALLATSAAAADFSAWTRTMTFTVSGYTRAETLTNFPVLVKLGTNLTGFAYDQFQSGPNADLRFTDATLTNELNYEVESWNTGGVSTVWVQVPLLTTTATTLRAFWGQSAQTPPASTTNGAAWDAFFRGVWHLKEDQPGTGTAKLYRDSSTFTNHGTDMTAATGKVGVANGGQDFNGSSDYIDCGASTNLNGTNALSVSAWIYRDTTADGHIAHTGGGWSQNGYSLWVYQGSIRVEFDGQFYDNTAPAVGAWHHVGMTWDQASLIWRTYINGNQAATTRSYAGPIKVNANSFSIGRNAGQSGYKFDGKIDEVRVSRLRRSADWMWAEFMTVASNAVFVTNGAVQLQNLDLPQAATRMPAAISAAGASLNGSLVATGTTDTAVWVFWDEGDAGATNTGWAYATNWPAPQATGDYAVLVSLPQDRTWHYRFAASNSAGWAFSGPASFMTAPVSVTPLGDAAESGPSSGTVLVSRAASATGLALTISYTVGGSASNGVDYAALAGTVSLAAGQSNATLVVAPLADYWVEGPETVTIAVSAGLYPVGTPGTATVIIVDNPHLVAFLGGPNDGWALGESPALGLGAGIVTLLSANTTYIRGGAATAAPALTITDDAVTPATRAGTDLRVAIPADLLMSWDTTDTAASLGGSAAGKVSPTVTYADAGKTLVLDVTADFAAGDTLTVGGLAFASFLGNSVGSLALDIDNDGLPESTDPATQTIVQRGVAGGPDDGAGARAAAISVAVSEGASIVTLSSAATTYTRGSTPAAAPTVTIGDDPASPGISAANDLRVTLPPALLMTWDTTDTAATLGGTAAGKVSPTVAYANAGKTLVLDVTAGFAAGDTLTVGGLSFANFVAASLGSLTLDINNDGIGESTDPFVQTLLDRGMAGGPDDGASAPTLAAAVGMGASVVTLASADTAYIRGSAPAAAPTLAIGDDASTPGIKASTDLRVTVPASLFMAWHTADTTAALGGTAAAKVSPTVSYAVAGRTLVLDVTSDFAAGDTLTVGGLAFADFVSAGIGSLTLDFNNDGAAESTDPRSQTIGDRGMAGGPDDGAAAAVTDRERALMPRGVTFLFR